MSGTPVLPIMGSYPTHLSGPDWAKRVDSPSWVSLSTLMPHAFATAQAAELVALRASEKRTRGGSSDTELNELTVIPCRAPSGPSTVTTAMPVGNNPKILRNSADVNAISVMCSATQRSHSNRGDRRG